MDKRKINILIVDDRRENLLAFEAVLKSSNYHLVLVSSGEEALKCLLKDEFAVILLDVQMPEMDGFETANLIRSKKSTRDIPIIFITAIYQDTENIVHGYSLGAIDYLFKPFHPETLKLKIEAFVKMYLHREQIKFQNELLTQRAVELEKLNRSLESTTLSLRKAEALARAIGDTSTDTVLTLDGAGYILNVNPAVMEMFGYLHEELLGQHFSVLFPGEGVSILESALLKGSRSTGKISKIQEVTATSKEGVVFPVEVHNGGTNMGEQQIFIWSIRDITERKQHEQEREYRCKTLEMLVQERTRELSLTNEKLRQEILVRNKIEEQLRRTSLRLTNILESITDVFFSLNHQWQFIFLNEEAEKFWLKGRDELIGHNIWELFPEVVPRYYHLYQKVMDTMKATHFETRGFHSDMWYDVYIYPSKECLSVYYRDISQRKMFEKEMARLDRLNLVGQMAAGLGHEIRNPMTTVRGLLQILGDKEEFNQSKSFFKLMIEELDRANSIISEFLNLAKNKAVDLKSLNLNSLIEILLPLINADTMVSDNNINVELQGIEVLLLDEKEIRQLVLNLVRNGLEAMPGGGTLTIKTFMDGEEVVLAVGDEGSGIDNEALENIGTPFFTTKENGTGLGLATCFSIAARHNAEIKLETGLSGTTFFVRFKQHQFTTKE